LIEFQGLSFKYPGGGLPALRDISLRIADGAVFLIIGESGSGKTTLARILSGFLGPEDGEMTGRVTIDGKEDRKSVV
jgi:ABC-type bacteriocin/lantibiotic exporter with double-glycine peptidase domain